MSTATLHPTRYAVEAIQDEAKRLVKAGLVHRHDSIGHLKDHLSAREWEGIAEELELKEYRFDDPICDLIGTCEEWRED